MSRRSVLLTKEVGDAYDTAARQPQGFMYYLRDMADSIAAVWAVWEACPDYGSEGYR